VSVLSDDQMGQQPDPLAHGRQVFKTGEWDLRQVSDPVYRDDNLCRPSLGQLTIQKSNHVVL
jgi:hypothetical protein